MTGEIIVPTPGPALQGPVLSIFEPQLNLISNVTNAVGAVVTTVTPHGYLTGMVVRLNVPRTYKMFLFAQATIAVTSPTTFTTDVDTSKMNGFVAPSLYPPTAFTPAQCIPMTGTEDNVA